MATFTNQSKNSSTLTNQNPLGLNTWDDVDIDWDDSLFGLWDGSVSFSNQSKNTSVLSNQTKN